MEVYLCNWFSFAFGDFFSTFKISHLNISKEMYNTVTEGLLKRIFEIYNLYTGSGLGSLHVENLTFTDSSI